MAVAGRGQNWDIAPEWSQRGSPGWTKRLTRSVRLRKCARWGNVAPQTLLG